VNAEQGESVLRQLVATDAGSERGCSAAFSSKSVLVEETPDVRMASCGHERDFPEPREPASVATS